MHRHTVVWPIILLAAILTSAFFVEKVLLSDLEPTTKSTLHQIHIRAKISLRQALQHLPGRRHWNLQPLLCTAPGCTANGNTSRAIHLQGMPSSGHQSRLEDRSEWSQLDPEEDSQDEQSQYENRDFAEEDLQWQTSGENRRLPGVGPDHDRGYHAGAWDQHRDVREEALQNDLLAEDGLPDLALPADGTDPSDDSPDDVLQPQTTFLEDSGDETHTGPARAGFGWKEEGPLALIPHPSPHPGEEVLPSVPLVSNPTDELTLERDGPVPHEALAVGDPLGLLPIGQPLPTTSARHHDAVLPGDHWNRFDAVDDFVKELSRNARTGEGRTPLPKSSDQPGGTNAADSSGLDVEYPKETMPSLESGTSATLQGPGGLPGGIDAAIQGRGGVPSDTTPSIASRVDGTLQGPSGLPSGTIPFLISGTHSAVPRDVVLPAISTPTKSGAQAPLRGSTTPADPAMEEDAPLEWAGFRTGDPRDTGVEAALPDEPRPQLVPSPLDASMPHEQTVHHAASREPGLEVGELEEDIPNQHEDQTPGGQDGEGPRIPEAAVPHGPAVQDSLSLDDHPEGGEVHLGRGDVLNMAASSREAVVREEAEQEEDPAQKAEVRGEDSAGRREVENERGERGTEVEGEAREAESEGAQRSWETDATSSTVESGPDIAIDAGADGSGPSGLHEGSPEQGPDERKQKTIQALQELLLKVVEEGIKQGEHGGGEASAKAEKRMEEERHLEGPGHVAEADDDMEWRDNGGGNSDRDAGKEASNEESEPAEKQMAEETPEDVGKEREGTRGADGGSSGGPETERAEKPEETDREESLKDAKQIDAEMRGVSLPEPEPDAEEEEAPEPNPGVDKAHLMWADPKSWGGPNEVDYGLGRDPSHDPKKYSRRAQIAAILQNAQQGD
eukprot:jgi/Botrbrau1/1129/Bobra.0162s0025.1